MAFLNKQTKQKQKQKQKTTTPKNKTKQNERKQNKTKTKQNIQQKQKDRNEACKTFHQKYEMRAISLSFAQLKTILCNIISFNQKLTNQSLIHLIILFLYVAAF